MENKTVAEIVRKQESDDRQGVTTISKYVTYSLRENVEKIDAYLNSKHISGETDSLNREKPFFNIVTAACNIWFRATDIDRKNIRVKATKKAHQVISLLSTILLQEWMRKSRFGIFLNEWGRVLSRYGSAVVKFIEKDGELHCDVIPWNRLIIDPIDFDNNVVIEKLELTPAQLKQNPSYNKEIVDELLECVTTRKTISGMQKDTKSDYIPIYEVHGELPLSNLTGKEKDDDDYVQQMHVITFLKGKNRGEFDDFTLYSGREKSPYMITHLIKEDGRSQAIGAVEHLFEAQWMMNHTVKEIKDQLDLTSKIIYQTSDGNFVGQNALNAIENGEILIHALNQPLTEVQSRGQDIVSLQNFGQQWQMLGNQINGISESMLGQNPPSGTAWRQTEALLQESRGLFELMTENKGLYVEEMLRTYVIPFLKKQMDTTEEISAILESRQINQRDSLYLPAEVIKRTNTKVKSTILNGGIVDPLDMEMFKAEQAQKIQGELNSQGNQRFIKPSDISTKTWKEVLKDLEWEIECDITGESVDRQLVMTTLNTALQVMANPAFSQNKKAQLIVDKILEETGVLSSLELNQVPDQQPNPAMPLGGQQVGAGQQMPQMQSQTK